MADDLRPYAGKRVRVVEADRTITGVLDYLVDKHGQLAAGSAIVRDAAVRCGDVVVLAQHAERIEVVEDTSESLRERADTAERRVAEYENAISWGTDCVAHATLHDECRRQEERAEKAEARLADVRSYIDEDFRFWCSPHGVASRYAKALLEFIDREAAALDDTTAPE